MVIYILLVLAFLALQIAMVVKFFQMASDMRMSKDIQLQSYKLQLFGREKQEQANKAIFGIDMPKCHLSNTDNGTLLIFDDKHQGVIYYTHELYFYKDNSDCIYFSTKDDAIKGLYLYLIHNHPLK